MDGGVISVCSYSEFNHSFLAAGAAAFDEVLAPAIAVPVASFIGCSVRVHARTISAAAPASYQVIIRGSNPSRKDGAEFQFLGADASTPTITSSSNPAVVPGLTQLSTPMSGNQHPYIKMILRATPPPSGVVQLQIILSVDVVWRSGT